MAKKATTSPADDPSNYQHRTPTEIIQEGAQQYRNAGGTMPLMVDANRQAQFTNATGPRVARVELEKFDEVEFANQIRSAVDGGAGTYVLTLRASQTNGFIARVPGFEVRGGSVQPAAAVASPAAAAGSSGPGWKDILDMQKAATDQMIELVKSFTTGNRNGGSPTLTELMAIMPKPTTMSEQMTTMATLYKLMGSMQKGMAGVDAGGGEDENNVVALGIKAFMAAMENAKQSAGPGQATERTRSTPPAAAAAPTPTTAPPATPASAPPAADPQLTPEDQAAQLAWGSIGAMLQAYAGKDPAATADALAPFLGACKFDVEILGIKKRIDGWEALAAPDEIVTRVVESFAALDPQRTWLRSVVDELIKIDKEDE